MVAHSVDVMRSRVQIHPCSILYNILSHILKSLNHATSPLLLKKGDCWVVSMLNNQVYAINTSLRPGFNVESLIHYGDIIWDTCHLKIGVGEVITRSSYETTGHIIMYLMTIHKYYLKFTTTTIRKDER